MATRASTHFYDNEKHIISFYKHSDGFTKGGYGEYLGHYLNGFDLGGESILTGGNGKQANGLDCFVLQFIKEFKHDVGGFYLSTAEDTQEYDYHLYFVGDGVLNNIEALTIRIVCNGAEVFNGSLNAFLDYIML